MKDPLDNLKPQNRKTSMLRRIVMLIAFAIIAFMGFAIYSMINTATKYAAIAKGQSTVAGLSVAAKGYFNQFGRCPTNTAATILVHTNIFDNPRSILFFDFPSKELLKSNSVVFFVDPWKRPYRIRFDADYDRIVTNPANEALEASVLVWSLGPDGIEATQDDVKSW